MPLPPEELLDWAREYISACYWKNSKQGADHAYTVRDWRPESDSDFVRFVELIRTYGHPENFYSKTYIYLHLDGLKYWTMGSPMNETIIINRAPSSKFYGRQVVAVTNRTYAETVYDGLASRYDDKYSNDFYNAENIMLFNALGPYLRGSILDIGAGTGFLLEHAQIPNNAYLALEPSQGMRNEFIRKFPHHAIKQITFDEYELQGQFDVALSLFGSPSYIDHTHYEKLLVSGRDYYFMFYKQGYLPDYYTSPDETLTNYGRIKEIFPNTHIFTNYLIATNLDVEGKYENL